MTDVVTDRLHLRTLTRDEAAAVRVGERAGRGWAPDYPTEGDLVVAGVVLEAGDAYDEDTLLGVFQVVERDTGVVVGGAGFLHAPDDDGRVELGYGLAASARGRGYATEAVQALVGLARGVGVRALVALTDPGNEASHRVLRRSGFLRAGEEVVPDDGRLWRWERRLDG